MAIEGGHNQQGRDRVSPRQYEARPLSPDGMRVVERRMRGFPVGLELAADKLRGSEGILGRRIALGLQGGTRSEEARLIVAGSMVNQLREDSSLLGARTPQDLEWTGYFPVQDFGPGEIGAVQRTIVERRAQNGFDLTDIRYVGYFDARSEGGFALGVVDTQEHTRTEIDSESSS